MSKIQRYGGDTMLFADDFGDIVIYEDHAAIVTQLEADLAEARKDQARYKFVQTMTYEEFGNTSDIPDDFDRQIDQMIKEQQ